MDTAHIAELLDPFLGPPDAGSLAPDALAHISTYIDILLRWNSRINLTAIRDPKEIVLRHFGESLFAARHLLPRSPASPVVDSPSSASPVSSVVGSGCSVADIGSGAGFPGIPLKLWAPQISLTLIESNHKKATFLREAVRSLTLTDVNIKNTRAESLTDTFDLVTLRAVEDFASILPTAAALVAPTGRLGLLIGSAQVKPAYASLPGLLWSEPIPVPLSTSRVILIGRGQGVNR